MSGRVRVVREDIEFLIRFTFEQILSNKSFPFDSFHILSNKRYLNLIPFTFKIWRPCFAKNECNLE